MFNLFQYVLEICQQDTNIPCREYHMDGITDGQTDEQEQS